MPTTSGTPEPMQLDKLQRQQRLLMFLRHCAKCTNSNCNYGTSCTTGKDLWNHITSCKDQRCQYPRCLHSRNLLRHYQKCESLACPICVPIKQVVTESGTAPGVYNPQNGYMQQGNGMVPQMQMPGHSMSMAVAQRQNSGMVSMQPAASIPPPVPQGQVRSRPDVPVPPVAMAPATGMAASAGITVPPSRKRQRADMDHIKACIGQPPQRDSSLPPIPRYSCLHLFHVMHMSHLRQTMQADL